MAVCKLCNGTGIFHNPPTGDIICPNCDGVGQTPEQLLADIVADIFDKVKKIKKTVDDIWDAVKK